MSADEAVTHPTQTALNCGACGVTVDVTWHSKNCPGSLCSSCRDAHRSTYITSKHSVVPRTSKVIRSHGPAKIAEQCRFHPDKEISVYCNECKVSCCISCLVEKHQGHELSPIEEKYLAAERRLNDYTKRLEKDVIPKLDDMEAQIRSEVKDGDKQREKVKEEVNAFREEIKQVVHETCDSLIDAIDRPMSDLNDKLHDIDKQRKKVTDLIQSCSDKVREGKLDVIEYTPPTPSSLLRTLVLPVSQRPTFVPGREVLDLIKNKIGSVKQVLDENYSLQSPNLLYHALSKFDKCIVKVKKLSIFQTKSGAKSISTASKDKAWVVRDYIDTMYLYSGNGEVVRSVTVKEGVGINDIVITTSGEIIVINDDKKVRCVSVSGEVSTLIDTAPYDTKGVCLTKNGEIVMCMISSGVYGDECKNYVAVYSSDGRKKLREIRCQDYHGKRLITKPYRVVQNVGNLCVVDDSYVVCVDERDGVRWVYDGTQAKLKKSFSPHGISSDKYHNLLVTDYNNHCVHYIDKDGLLIKVILTQEQLVFTHHWGISVDDEHGLVWIGNVYNSYIVVAQYIEK